MPGLGRATGARVDAQRTASDGRVGSGQAERSRGAAARELGEDVRGEPVRVLDLADHPGPLVVVPRRLVERRAVRAAEPPGLGDLREEVEAHAVRVEPELALQERAQGPPAGQVAEVARVVVRDEAADQTEPTCSIRATYAAVLASGRTTSRQSCPTR